MALQTDITPPILIATDPRGVKMYSPENSSLQTIENKAKSGGVAFDYEMGTVYWSAISSQYGVFRANIDGSGAECIKKDTGMLTFHKNVLGSFSWIHAQDQDNFCFLGKIYGLAYDWVVKNIYYADFDNNRIGVCTQNGSKCRTLLERKDTVKWPTGLVLDPERG